MEPSIFYAYDKDINYLSTNKVKVLLFLKTKAIKVTEDQTLKKHRREIFTYLQWLSGRRRALLIKMVAKIFYLSIAKCIQYTNSFERT